MIEVTPVAADKLQSLRATDPRLKVLRVYVAGRSCSGFAYGMSFDESADTTDAVSEERGIPVAVDPQSLPYVQGATIDYIVSDEGEGFTVRNPTLQVESGGCGGGCACGH